jgi:hypothetical protein
MMLAGGSMAATHAREPNVRVIEVPHNGQKMFASVDAGGAIHVATQTRQGPRYLRSDDNGLHFSAALPMVVGRDDDPAGLEYTIWDFLVEANGQTHAAIGTNAWKLKLPKEQWGFYYTRRTPNSDTFVPLRNINGVPSEGFSLAADGKGRVTACWLEDKLYANISRDGGETFEPTVEVDPAADPCNCCTTAATYMSDGRLAIFYREETNNQRDMHLLLWDQATGSTSRSRISRTPWQVDTCPMTYYSVRNRGSGLVVAWPTQGKIYFTTLNAKPDSLNKVDEIATGGENGMRSGILALSNPAGETMVVWKKDDQLNWRLYNARNQPLGTTHSAKSPGKGAAAIVDREGQFAVLP